ncbi:MAG: response regulator [Desulfobacteraceae bacterium]|nr:response regulator [Desulfobacteraceae bacterium]
MVTNSAGNIFVVDDDRFVLESVTALLEDQNYNVHAFSNGQDAIKQFINEQVDLVLTDVNMPVMDGLELLEKIRFLDKETPVMLMTAYADLDIAVQAIQKGAFDFIIKPYRPPYLIHTVEKGVNFKRLTQLEKNYKIDLEKTVQKRTIELNAALEEITTMSREIIERLTAAAELRDEDTGLHISRIGMYAKRIARQMGMDDVFVNNISVASAMHDIGKIGIPDSILLKPGSLTSDEFTIIKQHTVIGERILRGSRHDMLKMSAVIAATHHERWDGSGYPAGLKGEETPLEGRIVMIADQYDALRNSRVYKPAFSHDKTSDIILNGDGRTMPTHFDPRILTTFREIADDFAEIFNSNCD